MIYLQTYESLWNEHPTGEEITKLVDVYLDRRKRNIHIFTKNYQYDFSRYSGGYNLQREISFERITYKRNLEYLSSGRSSNFIECKPGEPFYDEITSLYPEIEHIFFTI